MKKIIIIGVGGLGLELLEQGLENRKNVTLIGIHLEINLKNKIKLNKNFHPALKIK